MENKLILGDCQIELAKFEAESTDLVVTDPPYGYSFMGKDWDKAVPKVEVWRECLRVLKPGAFAFVMSSPRADVLAHMIVNLSDAGFRTDFTPIYWAYASGFPKAMNIGKAVDKRGATNLSEFAKIIKARREELKLSRKELSEMGKFYGEVNHAGLVTNWETGYGIPTLEQYNLLIKLLKLKNYPEIQEAEREILGIIRERSVQNWMPNSKDNNTYATEPQTKEAKRLDGSYGGFQPKPSLEVILTCQKPLDKQAELTIISSQALQLIEVIVECLNVSNVESNIPEDMVVTVQELVTAKTIEEAKAQLGKVGKLWLADTLPSTLERIAKDIALTNWNIGLLWKSILVELLSQTSKFTIETAIELITELKTLNSLILSSIHENITLQKKTPQNGLKFNVSIVEIILKSVLTKLLIQRQISATENVISNTCTQNQFINVNDVEKILQQLTPNASSVLSNATGKVETKVIIVAMKPLSEKTFVDQALKNGKGLTWLDDARIPFQNDGDYKQALDWTAHKGATTEHHMGRVENKLAPEQIINQQGRFPANLLVSDDCLNDGTNHANGYRANPSLKTEQHKNGTYGKYQDEYLCGERGYPDEGSFSRYFSLDAWFEKQFKKLPLEVRKTFPFLLEPKASKTERNTNLDKLPFRMKDAENRNPEDNGGIQDRIHGKTLKQNFHPTVKPLQLMSYLITLGSRPNDLILDPFAGSGTTCLAAKMLGRRFLGIELEAEYYKIAEARVGNHRTLSEFALT
jgi:site-specific DNA-methyltransferase (adenine-specific)